MSSTAALLIASPSAVASSSRLPETPVNNEVSDVSLTDSNSISNKKRKITDARVEEDDDEDIGDSLSSAASPSKPATGGRRKANDEERKARLEARQARNRLSAQYSRERKKAYVEQLEGSLNALKAENTLLRQQRDQDQLVRQALDGKLQSAQLRINTLESIIRSVAPSLVPLIMSSSSSPSSSAPPSSSPAFAGPSTSAVASQIDAGLSADLVSALLQNNGLTNKEVTVPLTVAAPASTSSSSLSLGACSQQTSNEGVRLPAADVFTQFDGVAGQQEANGRTGSNVDVNGSSIISQGYPPASQISVLAPEHPSTIAGGPGLTLSQHPVEAKVASGHAREAEALLSNFIDLDAAKLTHGDEATKAQDQGAQASASTSQSVSVGKDDAATAEGAQRSAGTSAGELASLSATTTMAGSVEDESGSKFDSISLAHNDTHDVAIHADDKDGNHDQRFQLLNSPLLPSERNMWELATDTMLQDIYSTDAPDADMSAPSVSATDSTDVSAGSSPFDLVDLDIEIEEPLHLNFGLDEASMAKAEAASMDWPGLFASLVA